MHFTQRKSLWLMSLTLFILGGLVSADDQEQPPQDSNQVNPENRFTAPFPHGNFMFRIDRNGRPMLYSAPVQPGRLRPFEIIGDAGFEADGHQEAFDENRLVIGAVLRPLPEGVHGLLGIEEGQGFLLTDILPEGPAAQAGVQQNDLLLELNGEPVKSITKFRETLEELGSVEVTIQLRRKLDTLELKVLPVKFSDIPREELNFTGQKPEMRNSFNMLEFPQTITQWHMPQMSDAANSRLDELHKDIESLREQMTEEQQSIRDALDSLRKDLQKKD